MRNGGIVGQMATEQRFRAKIAPANEAGCQLWTAGTAGKGYGKFNVGGRDGYAHRFAWEQAYGPIPAGMFVCHRCDTPRCVSPAHLFLGTGADNAADRDTKGRWRGARGSKHGRAKLNEAQAVAVFLATGTQRAIGARHGISGRQVCDIKRRKYWAHATASCAGR